MDDAGLAGFQGKTVSEYDSGSLTGSAYNEESSHHDLLQVL
jgi:hypothetical protein